ncbi:MAG: hypothetical protein Q9M43_02945 [Sulfurimonas sp.]|nr:hypothetical protein [Sulfurimonas sp.]
MIPTSAFLIAISAEPALATPKVTPPAKADMFALSYEILPTISLVFTICFSSIHYRLLWIFSIRKT